MSQKKIVIKLGGSLVYTKEGKINRERIHKLTEIFQEAPYIKAIIIGGGKIAREFISTARTFQVDETFCDDFGIKCSRLNAQLLLSGLKEFAYPKIMENLQQVREAALWDKIILAGGFIPGQSTTSVSFEIAETIHATDVIILTDVDGIYDKDPHKFPSAKKYSEISVDELAEILYKEGGNTQAAAGEYRILDAVSIQIMKRSKINVRLADGTNYPQLHQLLKNQESSSHIGTQITL